MADSAAPAAEPLPHVASAEADVARSAVQAALALLREHFAAGVEVGYKGPGDIVTAADHAAQQLVRDRIASAFPHDLFVGEEGCPPAEHLVHGRRRWYVDPLDGTANFVKGSTRWAVSVAFCDADDRMAAAAVATPRHGGEVLSAVRGRGVRCGGQVLPTVTDRAPGDTLALFGPVWDLSAAVAHIGRRCLGVRMTGSTVSDLTDLVRGRAGCYLGTGQGRWDLAAGTLLAREAGFIVTDLAGQPLEGPGDEALVALPSVHAAVAPDVFTLVRSRRVSPGPKSEGAG